MKSNSSRLGMNRSVGRLLRSAPVLPAVLLLAAVALHLSCGEDPAAPTRDNPLDPGNPETGGDPFGLVAEVRADGVRLTWSIPEGPAIAELRMLRRDDRAGGYSMKAGVLPPATSWTDGSIANGHTYEYKVIAVDRDSRTSSESSVREVRVDMDPVWTLNNGQQYAYTRSVPMTLLATTAVSMRVFAGTDTSGVEWVPATGTPSVTLAGDQGVREVSGQVRYDDGSRSPLWTGSVILDTEPPVIALSQTGLDANTRTVAMSAEGTLDHSEICPVDSLTYRWDWGDGQSVGPSMHLASHSHQYEGPGPWTITLTVKDLAGHEADTTWVLPLPNQPPSEPVLSSPAADADDVERTASLAWQASTDPEGDVVTYNVYHGPVGSMARVASGISDTSLNLAQPMGYSVQYEWKAVAVDEWGDSAESDVRRFTTVANQLPTTPSGPNPPDGAPGVSRTPTLSWTASSDPEGTAVTYDVYFSTSSSLVRVSQDQTETTYDPGLLESETIYYWKVVARDEDGGTSDDGEQPGPVWSFTTVANQLPTIPSDPRPADGATGVSRTPTLSWAASTDPEGTAVTYDVYFGESSLPDVPVSFGQADTTYAPDRLEYDTTYYWKVVAKDEDGGEAFGPEWSFTAVHDGLLAYYPFDGNADDTSGNGRHGIVTRAILTKGRDGSVNGAYRFNGRNTRIDLGFGPGHLYASLTANLWLRSLAEGIGFGGHDLNASGRAWQAGNFIAVYGASSQTFRILGNGNYNANVGRVASHVNSGVNLTAGRHDDGLWHMFTLVWDGEQATLYIDGQQSHTYTAPGIISPVYNWFVGARDTGGSGWPGAPFSEHAECDIDDLSIWDRALTPQEIADLWDDKSAPVLRP